MSSSRESGPEEKKRTVPKFASFKPKLVLPQVPEPEAKAPEKKTSANGSRRRRDTRHDHQDGGRERRREAESLKDGKVTVASTEPSSLFFLDKKGDPLIRRYGSNDRGKVPTYHRFGAGRVLGSPGLLRIHGPREFSIRNDRRNGSSAFRDKNAIQAAAVRLTNAKRIRLDPGAARLPTASDDYISLEPSKKRKRGEEGSASTPAHLSLYQTAEDSDSENDDVTSTSGDDVDGVEMTLSKKRSIELSRRIRDDPGDIASWLDLIKLQDALFKESHGGGSQINPQIKSADEAMAFAKLKLSLYEEALPNARQPVDQEMLLEGMMREGTRVWDARTLAKRWDQVSKKHPASFVLWRARLNFELAKAAECSYEGLREFLAEKLHHLSRRLFDVCASGKEHEAEDVTALCDQLVYVFLRLTRFLHDSGYVELSVAAWQAVLELTFCRPATLPEIWDDIIPLFSNFWESELPRIGEDDGFKCCWRCFVEDAEGTLDAPEPKASKLGEKPRTRDVFKAWAITETQTATNSRMPARTLDDGVEDDPNKVVMFSDIKDLLIWFPEPALLHAGPRLLDAYLLFCGFPAAHLADGLVSICRDDPYVVSRSESFADGISRKPFDSVAAETRRTPELRQQGGILALSQEVLFPGADWFQYLNKRHGAQHLELDQVDFSWVLNTLRHLVKLCGIEALAEYYLAMEWRNDPGSAKKAAKGLLKLYSSNVGLYNAYARIEWANGNMDISEKVLAAATSQELSPTPMDSQILWNTWAWIHLESGQKRAALSRLCSSVDRKLDTSAPSPALLLKTKSHLSSTRDYTLSSRKLDISASYAKSLVLLEYLSAEGNSGTTSHAQGNITAALASVGRFEEELISLQLGSSLLHEEFLQSAARLLYYHATHGPHRPSYIRTHLVRFASVFPRNTIFLELFSWAESALRIDDPIRTHLGQTAFVSQHDCLSTRRFAIRHEASAGTAHSTRAAFEAALDSDACRGNTDMWVRYIRFCYNERELRERAKEVFYRAIAACPMAKEVYMEGFQTMVKNMESAELRTVFNTMMAKGLRLHVDLDEWEEKWGK